MPQPAFSFDAIVTWIINPNHFYVRLRSDEELKCRMEYLLNGYLESNELKKPELNLKLDLPHHPGFGDVLEYSNFSKRHSEELHLHLANDEEIEENDVEPMLKTGDFVLARSRKILETEFLRGRIKEIMRNDVLGWFYLIFFYDFGQEQWVHVEDIRLMPEKIRKFDGLAYKCTLKGIYPQYKTGDGWSNEAKDFFLDFCRYKGTVCRVQMDMIPDLYRTNVVTVLIEKYQDEKKIVSDWVDVKEYMLNLNYGQLMFPRATPVSRRIKEAQEQLPKHLVAPGRFMVTGSVTVVRLAYFLDPSMVYIHPLPVVGGNLAELARMEAHMKAEMDGKFWSNVRNNVNTSKLWKGQLCAFRHEEKNEDDKVYRVIIEKLSRKIGTAQIFFIDFGWRQICQCSSLIPLCSVFVHQYPGIMATRVQMFDVEPKNEKWPDEAYEAMAKYAGQDLYMYVVDGGLNVSSVILFDKSELVCINDEIEAVDWCEATNSKGAAEIFELAAKKVWDYMDFVEKRAEFQ